MRAIKAGATLLLLVLILAIGTSGGEALSDGEIVESGFFVNLFTDARASRIGDVVLVIISESAQALHQAARANDHKTANEVGPGGGWLDFIPLFGYGGASASSAKGVSSRQESFQARIAARVINITEEGNLIIEGTREVRVNKDTQRITLRGIVRPQDICRDNTVYSWNVANAEITYEGSDPARPGKKVGIITRVLNLLF